MRDPLGPLHQREELLVCCLADVGDGVVGLEEAENSLFHVFIVCFFETNILPTTVTVKCFHE